MRGHGDHEVSDLGGLDILGADLHLVLLGRHLNRTGGEVEVVGRDDVSHLLDGESVGVEFLLVDIDVDISVGRA